MVQDTLVDLVPNSYRFVDGFGGYPDDLYILPFLAGPRYGMKMGMHMCLCLAETFAQKT
jgi:5-deoxy-D-glucuronate isomerase